MTSWVLEHLDLFFNVFTYENIEINLPSQILFNNQYSRSIKITENTYKVIKTSS